jgi:hypothetical protein
MVKQAQRSGRAEETKQKLRDAIGAGWIALTRLGRWLWTGLKTVASVFCDIVRGAWVVLLWTLWPLHWLFRTPNRAICAATIAMAITSGLQWWAIGETNEEIAKSNKIINDQLAEMAFQNWIMWESNQLVGEQIGQTNDTIELMRLAQRPWLAIEGARIVYPFAVNNSIDLRLPVKNYGNSGGTITSRRILSYIEPIDPMSSEFDKLAAQFDAEPMVTGNPKTFPPQGKYELLVRERLHKMTPELIAAVEGKEATLYIFAKHEYVDASGNVYCHKFCFHFNVDMKPAHLIMHEKYYRYD